MRGETHRFLCGTSLLVEEKLGLVPFLVSRKKSRLIYIYNFYLKTISIRWIFNLLKPTGHVMHQQYNIQQLYALPTLYLCVLYLRTNSDLCHLQHKLSELYNRDEVFTARYELGL